MTALSYQPWYATDTYPAWDIPLQNDATLAGTSSTTVTPGSQAITCSAGFAASLTTATVIVVDAGGANQETVIPSAINAGSNQFTATFAKSHSGTYALVANAEDLTNVNMTTFQMVFRSSQGVDTQGTGTFSLKTAIPAEIYYKPSPADVASAWSGSLVIKCYFPPSNGPADEVVYDPIAFSITAS